MIFGTFGLNLLILVLYWYYTGLILVLYGSYTVWSAFLKPFFFHIGHLFWLRRVAIFIYIYIYIYIWAQAYFMIHGFRCATTTRKAIVWCTDRARHLQMLYLHPKIQCTCFGADKWVQKKNAHSHPLYFGSFWLIVDGRVPDTPYYTSINEHGIKHSSKF